VLQWSRFQYINFNVDVKVVGYDVTIITQALTVKTLPQEQQFRLDIIYKLHTNGFTNKEITEHLNTHNIRTPKGLLYNVGLVWCTLDKFKKRKLRMKYIQVSISEPYFYEKG